MFFHQQRESRRAQTLSCRFRERRLASAAISWASQLASMALGSSHPGSIPEIGMAARAWGRNTATTGKGDNEYERKNHPVRVKEKKKPHTLSGVRLSLRQNL